MLGSIASNYFIRLAARLVSAGAFPDADDAPDILAAATAEATCDCGTEFPAVTDCEAHDPGCAFRRLIAVIDRRKRR